MNEVATLLPEDIAQVKPGDATYALSNQELRSLIRERQSSSLLFSTFLKYEGLSSRGIREFFYPTKYAIRAGEGYYFAHKPFDSKMDLYKFLAYRESVRNSSLAHIVVYRDGVRMFSDPEGVVEKIDGSLKVTFPENLDGSGDRVIYRYDSYLYEKSGVGAKEVFEEKELMSVA